MNLLHPYTLVVHPDFKELKDWILSIPKLFTNGDGEIIYKGRNELRAFSHQGTRYVVKAFRRPNLVNRFVYGFLRPSKAKRAYLHAEMLREIGVGTPRPVGYLNIRQGFLFDRSYLITLEAECPHVYRELFEQKFEYEEEVLREIGRVTALLHNHGYAHKDYGRGNILFKQTPEGIKLEIVDLNRMDIGPLDIKAGCKNLERLPATPQMHRWLAEEYAQARGMDSEMCYQLMVAYRSTQPGKIDGKY
jgi:hypothetical protein